MSLREILNAGKASQSNIIKRIDKKYDATLAQSQQANQFIGQQYTHQISKCFNDQIISFYNSNIKEEPHHSSPQDSAIEIILEGQCYQVPFLDLSPSFDHFQTFISDISHKTGRSFTQQGINKIIENLKQLSLQQKPKNLKESNCLKVSTLINEDKSKTANSTIHSSKVQKTSHNKQNSKASRSSYQDAAKNKKEMIAKSRVTSNLPRSRVQVTGVTF